MSIINKSEEILCATKQPIHPQRVKRPSVLVLKLARTIVAAKSVDVAKKQQKQKHLPKQKRQKKSLQKGEKNQLQNNLNLSCY
jgi:hypothetical protein